MRYLTPADLHVARSDTTQFGVTTLNKIARFAQMHNNDVVCLQGAGRAWKGQDGGVLFYKLSNKGFEP